MRTAIARGVFCTALAVGAVMSARAQPTDNQVYANLSFNLSNPGARSLALAGAFTGLADDATAAYANPAGLTQIFKPQVSFEARYSSNDIPFTNGGAFFPVDAAHPFPFRSINVGTDTDSSTRPSFISLMLPHERWGISVYRHELANTKFSAITNPVQTPVLQVLPEAESLTLRMVEWGVAGAYNLNDKVSLGASLSYFQNALDSTLKSAVQTVPFADHGRQSAVAGNVGLLVKEGKASFGAVYHRSPDFQFASSSPFTAPQTVDFKAPDAFGIGFVYRFSDTFYSSTDVQRVEYSQLHSKFKTVISLPTDAEPGSYSVNNATEVRAGFEKAFFRAASPSVIALRFGGWRDPAHAVTYTGAITYKAAYFLPGKAVTHFTGGMGFVLNQFQADIGADVSSVSKVVSVSFVKSFKAF
jgi:long-chain fatty acid transport protein